MSMRSFFVIISLLVGIILGLNVGTDSWEGSLWGAALVLSLSLSFIWLEQKFFRFQAIEILGGFLGFAFGICLSGITSLVVSQQIFPQSPKITPLFTFALLLGFCYMGTTLGLRISRSLVLQPGSEQSTTAPAGQIRKILDTSAIIDGRIADLCETGFLEGPIIIPQFVLHELQKISDSADSQKRIRGKRGLDILRTIQEMETIHVEIIHDDFPQILTVDAKLVELAKQQSAKLVTTDMNLNKVATLQGIQVLNTNDLSNAIRPVVIPGEALKVFLLREGKDPGQGIAHLDDGTMVVVDQAKRSIGKQVEVVVTRVIQTSTGRMIFSSLDKNTGRLQPSFG